MIAPAHAYSAEVTATIARDRAVCRLATITAELRKRGMIPTWRNVAGGIVAYDAIDGRDRRRYYRASIACTENFHALYAAKQRHSTWYRAILRALRRRELQL
jgi:hypothetical protein